MKNKYLFLTLAILLGQWVLGSKSSAALARGAGAEIQYKYVSDSTYLVYYKAYQSCSSTTPEGDVYYLCYRASAAACGFGWNAATLNKMVICPDGKPNGQVVDSGCPNQTNTCTDPNATNEMYRVWWYSALVKLGNCGDWTLSVNVVDRVANANLQNPQYPYYNIYVEAHINTLLAPKQSSPFTTVNAPVYATAGNPFHFNFGVQDPDGDVLVYKEIAPSSAQADVFVGCAGYSPSTMQYLNATYNNTTNPLLCNNSFTLNAQNGDVDFTPAGIQSAYLAYRVDKYRGGQLIGSMMMDNRIEVRAGTTPPIQVNINATSVEGATLSNDTLTICSNNPMAFCFNATSTLATAQLQVSDNHSFSMESAAITYTGQGSANITGCVHWTPHLSDTGFRYFLVVAKDVSCGVPVFQSYKIPVLVKNGTEIFAKDTIVCPGASTKLTGTGGTGYNWTAVPVGTFSCTSCDTTLFSPSANSTVTLTSNSSNGCLNVDTVRILVDHSNSVNATPDLTVFCNGGEYVNFNAAASGPGPLKTVSCGAYSPQTSAGLTDVSLMENSNNSNSSSLYYGPYITYWGPFYQAFYTQKTQAIFRKDELISAGAFPGTIQKVALNFGTNATNTNPTFYNVKIYMRCTDKTAFLAPVQTEFETGLTQVFSATTYTIHPGINEFILNAPYDYDTSKNLNVQFCYSNVTPQIPTNSTTLLPIYYTATGYKSSLTTGQIGTGNACSSNLGNPYADRRRPDIRFTFSPLPPGNFQYNWTPATGMSNPSAASTGINVDSSSWFTVSTSGKLGCVVKDSVYVYVAKKDFNVYPLESDICEGDVVTINATGGFNYTWSTDTYTHPSGFNCVYCDAPNVGPLPIGSHNYKVIIADAYGCSDTLGAVVNVSAIPTTNILNNDTIINFGESVQLIAEGASYYIWNPILTLNKNNIFNPIANPRESTLYVVTGYASGGCSAKDSVWVNVRINETPFIPSAFSPNGDGLNDVFKVSNLTLQRIVSFNIFDRWGNHVYEAGPNQNGWDGTYKGQVMPLGTYFYYVVLELPDGKVRDYKGDVTLVR
jgi:gliding motility-associated-like protein